MAIGTEYLTSNAQVAFPFREDANGLARTGAPVYGVDATVPEGLFIDGLISVPANQLGLVSEQSNVFIYLKTITDAGGSVYNFVFADQYGQPVLSGSINLGTVNLDQPFHIFSFTTTIVPTGDFIGKFVASAPVLGTYLPGIVGSVEFNKRLPLEASVLDTRPPELASFTLYNNGLSNPPELPVRITGDVVFKQGYNSTFDVWPSTEDDTTEIELGMLAGSGDGPVPCDDEANVSSFVPPPMELKPDPNGNVQMEPGDACYSITPHPLLGAFELQGACDSCCSCDDYANTSEAIRRIGVEARDAQADLDAGHGVYENGVTHYNENIAPVFIEPDMRVNGMRGLDPRVNPKLNSAHHVRLVITVYNPRNEDLSITAMALGFTSPLGAPELQEINWELADGRGGRLGTFGNIGDVPDMTHDKSVALTVLAFADYNAWLSSPVWSGTVTATVTYAGGDTKALLRTFEIT